MSKRYAEICTTMCNDIEQTLEQFYFKGEEQDHKVFYTYVDVEKSSVDSVAFGVLMFGTEDFHENKFRQGLMSYLTRTLSVPVDIPRIHWGRTVNAPGSKERHLYLCHIFVPVESTLLRKDLNNDANA